MHEGLRPKDSPDGNRDQYPYPERPYLFFAILVIIVSVAIMVIGIFWAKSDPDDVPRKIIVSIVQLMCVITAVFGVLWLINHATAKPVAADDDNDPGPDAPLAKHFVPPPGYVPSKGSPTPPHIAPTLPAAPVDPYSAEALEAEKRRRATADGATQPAEPAPPAAADPNPGAVPPPDNAPPGTPTTGD